MKSGYWGNYVTCEWFIIDEHEFWLRRGNAARLGIPDEVIADFADFAPRRDRDCFLTHLMNRAPIMRIRGHGSSVTFEFASDDCDKPLELVRRWCEANAGPYLTLRIVNLKNLETLSCLWKDFGTE